MLHNKRDLFHFFKNEQTIKRLFFMLIVTFSALCFVDCMAATQIASVLDPVKEEINDFVDFGVILVWLVGLSVFFFVGVSKGNLVMGTVIGVVLPSIVTALALGHKFV